MANTATLIIQCFGEAIDQKEALDYLTDRFPVLVELKEWTNDMKAGGDKIISFVSFAMCSTKLLDVGFDKEALFVEIGNAPWDKTHIPLVVTWESDNEALGAVLVYDIGDEPGKLLSRIEN